MGMTTLDVAVALVATLALFASVGGLFLLANLLVGRLVRPVHPTPEKLEIYECGEPAIGSSFVQFDLRFYVVALLFLVFDVEVALFFPWATVFGKATHLMRGEAPAVAASLDASGAPAIALSGSTAQLMRELGISHPEVPRRVPGSLRSRVASDLPAAEMAESVIRAGSRQLAWLTAIDLGVFFLVLLVGFAYVWSRGDLDWVRAVHVSAAAGPRPRRSNLAEGLSRPPGDR